LGHATAEHLTRRELKETIRGKRRDNVETLLDKKRKVEGSKRFGGNASTLRAVSDAGFP